MSCVSEPSCACLAISSVDQKLLRWRKELYGELLHTEITDTGKELATLVREFRELHHQLLASVLGELVHAGRWLYSGVAGPVLTNGHLDHTQCASPDADLTYRASTPEELEAHRYTGCRPISQSSKPACETEPVYSSQAMWPPMHIPPVVGCLIDTPQDSPYVVTSRLPHLSFPPFSSHPGREGRIQGLSKEKYQEQEIL